jgi:hypothetical protein
VVAAPDSGRAIRIHISAPRTGNDPLSFGQLAAHNLLAAGAGPLLATITSAPQPAAN